MSIENTVNKIVGNIKDTISEAGHRAAAENEQAKRDVDGDLMTPGEKLASAVNQAKHTVQADVDATKRDVRNAT